MGLFLWNSRGVWIVFYMVSGAISGGIEMPPPMFLCCTLHAATHTLGEFRAPPQGKLLKGSAPSCFFPVFFVVGRCVFCRVVCVSAALRAVFRRSLVLGVLRSTPCLLGGALGVVTSRVFGPTAFFHVFVRCGIRRTLLCKL